MASDTEQADRALIEHLIRVSQDPATEPATFAVRPYEAFLLVTALQAMVTHPGMSPEMIRALTEMARRVQDLFAGPTYDLLERGWDRTQDVAAPDREDGELFVLLRDLLTDESRPEKYLSLSLSADGGWTAHLERAQPDSQLVDWAFGTTALNAIRQVLQVRRGEAAAE